MKYILIILISLFISLPSFANPSGKGIICDNVTHNYGKIGFIFFDKSLRKYMFDLLKRKSLKLKAATRTGIKSTYQCKIIVGEDEFLKEIDNIQKAYQKELDLELKANKI